MAAAYRVLFAAEAAAEVAAIAAWWHTHRLAAPAVFQDELKQALLNLAAHPNLGVRARVRKGSDVRAVVLRKSRYVVFYDVDATDAVICVLRVRHVRRRPLKKS